MPTWLYALICLAVPQLWAFALARGLDAHTRRQDLAARRRAAPEDFRI